MGPDCPGSDCNDDDPRCWAGVCCPVDCLDEDGDRYGIGPDCWGPDCDDADPYCSEGACCDPEECLDLDGDGYGIGPDCLGLDCDDSNSACWEGACCPVDCVDNDRDGFGVGVDCFGPDCDDSDAACWEGICCPGNLNLTGLWAERYCQNEEYDTPLSLESGIRITLNRIVLNHSGLTLHETSSVCGVIITRMGPLQITYPPALVNSTPVIVSSMTLDANRIGTAYDNPHNPLIRFTAWNPSTHYPESEELPEDPSDPRIYDQDQDGKVGGTALVTIGKLDCEIYIVGRDVRRVDGSIVSPQEINGLLEATSEYRVLDSSLGLCMLAVNINPLPGSTFQKVKLSDPSMTCEDIVANMDAIFGGPCPAPP